MSKTINVASRQRPTHRMILVFCGHVLAMVSVECTGQTSQRGAEKADIGCTFWYSRREARSVGVGVSSIRGCQAGCTSKIDGRRYGIARVSNVNIQNNKKSQVFLRENRTKMGNNLLFYISLMCH